MFWPILGLISCAVFSNQDVGTAISCTECSQVAGLIQKVSSSSSKVPSSCAVVPDLDPKIVAIVIVMCYLEQTCV